MEYCRRCVYPRIVPNLYFNEEGICTGCDTFEGFEQQTKEERESRKTRFEVLLDQYVKSNSSNYDCVVPVSGGKDSYYQTHLVVQEYGLKPLLVTYHGNNYLPEGDYNRDRMRHVFDADHLVWGPSVKVLKKLNRLCFRRMGDMNWHAHCGIFTAPIKIAVQFKIPLIFWGEIPYDSTGMFDSNDFVEFTARVRHEHDLRGFEWSDFLNDSTELLTEKDMIWAKYPSDEEILETGVRGIYIENHFPWSANEHYKLMIEKYGWRESEKPFERTYRTFSNLDDRYENGVHDLLKFIKFGFGRASDHASKDIRQGYMTRDTGIQMVRKYDHVVSSDLQYWLDYVGLDEEEFWQTADKFRDPRVWWIENFEWWKENIWGEKSSYGPVHFDTDQIADFNQRRERVIRNNYE